MKIYLDICCFNRPFDNQSQTRIRLESEAKLRIQDDILEGKFQLVWSYILDAENSENPFQERRRLIWKWRESAIINVRYNSTIFERAKYLSRLGLRDKDALHVSCALSEKSKYFLTTDDKIIKKGKFIENIIILNPIEFVREIYL